MAGSGVADPANSPRHFGNALAGLSEELESPDDAVDAFGLNVYSWCDMTAFAAA